MLSIICPAKYEQLLILHIFLSSEGRLGETETLQRGKAVEKNNNFFLWLPPTCISCTPCLPEKPEKTMPVLQATMEFHDNCPSTLRT